MFIEHDIFNIIGFNSVCVYIYIYYPPPPNPPSIFLNTFYI